MCAADMSARGSLRLTLPSASLSCRDPARLLAYPSCLRLQDTRPPGEPRGSFASGSGKHLSRRGGCGLAAQSWTFSREWVLKTKDWPSRQRETLLISSKWKQIHCKCVDGRRPDCGGAGTDRGRASQSSCPPCRASAWCQSSDWAGNGRTGNAPQSAPGKGAR